MRPHWMSGIHVVNGQLQGGFREWIASRHYQIYSPIDTGRFCLTVADNRSLCASFASDVSRFAGASLETMQLCDELAITPKACAWLVIRSYYAAFYASHAVGRILGTSVSQLDAEQVGSVFVVADAYGQSQIAAVQSGLYACIFDGRRRSIDCTKLGGSSGGSHELFWTCFLALLRSIGNRILQASSVNSQAVAAKLIDLSDNLCLEGRNGGNWLSHVRNDVTYRHARGTWFPYRSGIRHDGLRRVQIKWMKDPMEIDLSSFRGPSLERFIATCTFLVSLCHEILEDVARRCPAGRSFVASGPRAYLNRVGGPAGRATNT
jgi:hypothetical protein